MSYNCGHIYGQDLKFVRYEEEEEDGVLSVIKK